MRVRVQKTFEAPIYPENTDFVETGDDGAILLEDGSTETLLRGYFVTFESITTDGKGRRDEWTMQWEDPGLPAKGDYYDIEVRRGDVTRAAPSRACGSAGTSTSGARGSRSRRR